MNDDPKILSSEDSILWREAYLEAFVDTKGEYYKKHILNRQLFSDGFHHTGYLWDCLRSPLRITIQRMQAEIVLHSSIFVMADDHSRDRVPGAPLWPYPPNTVALFASETLLLSLAVLPMDIYVFDSHLSWTVVLTHENDGKRRTCCAVGIEA